jgi:hypothetical protein
MSDFDADQITQDESTANFGAEGLKITGAIDRLS